MQFMSGRKTFIDEGKKEKRFEQTIWIIFTNLNNNNDVEEIIIMTLEPYAFLLQTLIGIYIYIYIFITFLTHKYF